MTKKNLEIKKLNTQLGPVVIPDAVIGRLEEKKIKTLKDIRLKGGIPRFDDLPPEEEKAVKKVEAHAYISLISDDMKVNDTLIDAGFRNTADIAARPKHL